MSGYQLWCFSGLKLFSIHLDLEVFPGIQVLFVEDLRYLENSHKNSVDPPMLAWSLLAIVFLLSQFSSK